MRCALLCQHTPSPIPPYIRPRRAPVIGPPEHMGESVRDLLMGEEQELTPAQAEADVLGVGMCLADVGPLAHARDRGVVPGDLPVGRCAEVALLEALDPDVPKASGLLRERKGESGHVDQTFQAKERRAMRRMVAGWSQLACAVVVVIPIIYRLLALRARQLHNGLVTMPSHTEGAGRS